MLKESSSSIFILLQFMRIISTTSVFRVKDDRCVHCIQNIMTLEVFNSKISEIIARQYHQTYSTCIISPETREFSVNNSVFDDVNAYVLKIILDSSFDSSARTNLLNLINLREFKDIFKFLFDQSITFDMIGNLIDIFVDPKCEIDINQILSYLVFINDNQKPLIVNENDVNRYSKLITEYLYHNDTNKIHQIIRELDMHIAFFSSVADRELDLLYSIFSLKNLTNKEKEVYLSWAMIIFRHVIQMSNKRGLRFFSYKLGSEGHFEFLGEVFKFFHNYTPINHLFDINHVIYSLYGMLNHFNVNPNCDRNKVKFFFKIFSEQEFDHFLYIVQLSQNSSEFKTLSLEIEFNRLLIILKCVKDNWNNIEVPISLENPTLYKFEKILGPKNDFNEPYKINLKDKILRFNQKFMEKINKSSRIDEILDLLAYLYQRKFCNEDKDMIKFLLDQIKNITGQDFQSYVKNLALNYRSENSNFQIISLIKNVLIAKNDVIIFSVFLKNLSIDAIKAFCKNNNLMNLLEFLIRNPCFNICLHSLQSNIENKKDQLLKIKDITIRDQLSCIEGFSKLIPIISE